MGSRARVSESRLLGTVLSWKGRFGWIRADKRINHQESAKHGGRIYVHISDVDGREELTENARVSFMVYSDGDGLGAEQVRAESQVPTGPAYPSGAASVVKTRAAPAQLRSQGAGHAGPGQSSSATSKPAAKASATVVGPPKPKPKPHPCPARLKALLPSDCCCPISLTSLEELPVDPFGLLGTTEHAEVPKEGIWGEAAEDLLRTNPNQVIHWFDGRFLASFLVSSGQLIDPVNRRELSRGECRSLDEYICAHGCPAVHVADAFDLANAVKTTTQAEGPAAVRMAALEREAASMLRSLFDFRSVRNVPQPAWPTASPEPGAESEALQASEQSASDWPALGASSQDSAKEPASTQPERRIRACTRRTVHNDGGLQVVDDTEFDEEYEEDEDEPLFGPADPTLAESASAPRRARAARLPRSRGDRAQITFSVTGRARAEPNGEGRSAGQLPGSSQMRLSTQLEDSEGDDHQEDDQIPPPLEVEAWVPEWATPDLHERLLTEIDVVSAMFPDECQVLTQDVQAHLQECLSNGRVSRRPDPLRVQVAQHVDGPNGGCTVYLEFSLPPFYPLHEPSLTLKADEGVPVWMRDALQSLQGTLRTELHNLEGSEVMVKAVEWLSQHGPTALARERESSHVNKAPAKKQAPAVVQPAVESKADRIEQARRERLSAKFTEKWDLCYAFIKHGSCKDKNCQWRHELPPKKEEAKEVKETKVETKAKQGAGKKKSKA